MNDRDKINKSLTEAMGECWHNRPCEHPQHTNCYRNNDFSTWEGFGKLREFYDTWDDDKQQGYWRYADFNLPDDLIVADYIWHKDYTADLMYGFLQE